MVHMIEVADSEENWQHGVDPQKGFSALTQGGKLIARKATRPHCNTKSQVVT
jgi:hypothetical protein